MTDPHPSNLEAVVHAAVRKSAPARLREHEAEAMTAALLVFLTPFLAASVAAAEEAILDAAKDIANGMCEGVTDLGDVDCLKMTYSGDVGDAIGAIPLPKADALAALAPYVAAREKAAYQRGWNDREGDLLAGIDRIYGTEKCDGE